jgi:pyocin large subunit-like protein
MNKILLLNIMNKLTATFSKLPITKWTLRHLTTKSTDFSEGYDTKKEECKKTKKGFQRPPPMYGFKREVVPSDFDINKPKKNNFNCENEKWFPEQLKSGETWRDNIVHEDGHGKNMFHPKYGNSFWDPHNYN